ncbi:MAG: 2-dehydropantoate 2-reductase [Desulfobacteraceae bacterium]|jgi:2-dehydropantoate 2-reductase|nr:MAG: 2-dehydropantoate 2-reductase [Desulfobacteraceae bacterium]
MDIAVVGPGAMGCLFAARLKQSGNNVTLVDYKEQRAAFISSEGVRIEGSSGSHVVSVPAAVGKMAVPPEVIIVFVKATQTKKAAMNAATWAGPDSLVLTLQNGLGNMEILQEIFGIKRVAAGVTAEGGTLLEAGHVRHAGRGETIIGRPPGDAGKIERLVNALNGAGFSARLVDRVEELIWGKLLVNVGINALAAVTRLRNGDIPRIEPLRQIMADAVEEAMAVVRAKGVKLPYENPLQKVMDVCQATAVNLASMLQDVLRERTTEVEAINGAIVREASALGIPAPVNMALARIVKGIESSYDLRADSI